MKASWRKYCAWVVATGIMTVASPVWATSGASSLFAQALLDYKNGRYLEAQTKFFEVTALDPSQQTQCQKYLLEIPYRQGLQLLNKGKFAEAESYVRMAYKLQPGNAVIRQTLVELPLKIGKGQYEQGDCAAALANFQRYASVQPKDSLTHYYIANCLARTGSLKEALAEYHLSISLSPGSSTAGYAMAAIQAIQNGQNSAAVAAAAAHSSGMFNFSAAPPAVSAALAPSGLPAQAIQINAVSSNGFYGKGAKRAVRQAARANPYGAANQAPLTNYATAAVNAAPYTSAAGAAANGLNLAPYGGNPNVAAALNPSVPTAVLNPNGANNIAYPGLLPAANQNQNTLTAVPLSMPPLPAITPILGRDSTDPMVKQALQRIGSQGRIDQTNTANTAQNWQQNWNAMNTLKAAQITANYNAQLKAAQKAQLDTTALTAEHQAQLDAAAKEASMKAFGSQAWLADHSNLVNRTANNVQELLADPKSGLQPIGTDLYTRYYGGEPGKPVPEAHQSVARVQANGAGQKYPEFTVDDGVMTMKEAPKRDVSGQVLP